jgi:lysophospholipase L1-like esterase
MGFRYLKILDEACKKFPNVYHTSSYYLKSREKYGKIEGIDRFHPSNAGHSLYADMIINLINSKTFTG